MATATTERALANRLFSGASHSCKDTPLSCGGFSAGSLDFDPIQLNRIKV